MERHRFCRWQIAADNILLRLSVNTGDRCTVCPKYKSYHLNRYCTELTSFKGTLNDINRVPATGSPTVPYSSHLQQWTQTTCTGHWTEGLKHAGHIGCWPLASPSEDLRCQGETDRQADTWLMHCTYCYRWGHWPACMHAGAREGIIAGKSGGIISRYASHC